MSCWGYRHRQLQPTPPESRCPHLAPDQTPNICHGSGIIMWRNKAAAHRFLWPQQAVACACMLAQVSAFVKLFGYAMTQDARCNVLLQVLHSCKQASCWKIAETCACQSPAPCGGSAPGSS